MSDGYETVWNGGAGLSGYIGNSTLHRATDKSLIQNGDQKAIRAAADPQVNARTRDEILRLQAKGWRPSQIRRHLLKFTRVQIDHVLDGKWKAGC